MWQLLRNTVCKKTGKMEDEEEQTNELLALEAIYDERGFIRSKDEPGGELRIHIEVEQPFTLCFETGGGRKESNDKPEMQVKFLPPVVLNFSYPPTYPSTDPPFFALSCKWLNEVQLSKLCVQLDLMWENNGRGSVVLFEWTNFLLEETASFLDIQSPLRIRDMAVLRRRLSQPEYTHADSMGNLDGRAFQDVASILELRDYLAEYDRAEQQRQFNLNMFDCSVCFSQKLGEKCTSFYPCSHVFCNICMADYFRIQICDGSVKALTCPFDKCESQATPSQVRELVDDDLYEKYEKFLFQSSLDCMNDIIYCPRTICQSPVLIENGSTLGMCPKCSFAFCTLCKRSYHGVEACPINEGELKKLRLRYLNGSPEERLFLEKKYGRRNLKYAAEDMISEDWISKNSKKCPHCKAVIQKIDGCNKMTCFRCHGNFCWLCLKGISKSNPYSHFSDINSVCLNKLFDGVIINDQDYFDDDFD